MQRRFDILETALDKILDPAIIHHHFDAASGKTVVSLQVRHRILRNPDALQPLEVLCIHVNGHRFCTAPAGNAVINQAVDSGTRCLQFATHDFLRNVHGQLF